jgi:hypothetical protein
MPPQALPKFNLAKQPVVQFQTGHSPAIHAIVGAGRKYAGNERQGR